MCSVRRVFVSIKKCRYCLLPASFPRKRESTICSHRDFFSNSGPGYSAIIFTTPNRSRLFQRKGAKAQRQPNTIPLRLCVFALRNRVAKIISRAGFYFPVFSVTCWNHIRGPDIRNSIGSNVDRATRSVFGKDPNGFIYVLHVAPVASNPGPS